MRIVLAGATGAIGRPLVRRLVDAGRGVVGLTRRPERIAALEAAGARGAPCDVLDLAAVRAVVRDAQPDVVMDQSTALPQRYDARRMDVFYRDMVPLRLIGSPNLLCVSNARSKATLGWSPQYPSIVDGLPGEAGRPGAQLTGPRRPPKR